MTVYQRVYEPTMVPGSLLRCAEEPAVPPAPVTEFAALAYIARLRTALLDCHARLAQLRVLLEP